MNKFITFLILLILVAVNLPETSAQKSKETRSDSLRIASVGNQNQVIINSENVTQLNGCINSPAVNGEIVQRGEKNSVEINTKLETPNNKRQITNNDQKSNIKIQTKPAIRNQQPVTCDVQPAIRRQSDRPAPSNAQPETCNVLKRSKNPETSGKPVTSTQHPATIKITQSGNNNTVKINSR